jgi:hypothetical protein
MALIEVKNLPARQEDLQQKRERHQKKAFLERRKVAIKDKTYDQLNKKEKDDLLQMIAEHLDLVKLA